MQRVRECVEKEVLDGSCVLWLRDEILIWQILQERAKEINIRASCSSVPLISSHHSFFVESDQKWESKIGFWCFTGQDHRTQNKVEKLESGSQEQTGHFKHSFQIKFTVHLDNGLKYSNKLHGPLRVTKLLMKIFVVAESTYVHGPLERLM